MYGWGILKTLAITIYHFLMTYVEDLRRLLMRKEPSPAAAQVSDLASRRYGVFTVQYPDERRQLPERSRTFPFFIIDGETGRLRCTACGVCAQICPVQCIWIERATDPETGRPRRYPVAYYVDISLCMNCGYCAEFCPFDAVKMDQEYELAFYKRPGFVSARDLAKPESYHAQIHPTAYAEEQRKRQKKKKKAQR